MTQTTSSATSANPTTSARRMIGGRSSLLSGSGLPTGVSTGRTCTLLTPSRGNLPLGRVSNLSQQKQDDDDDQHGWPGSWTIPVLIPLTQTTPVRKSSIART